MYHVHRTWTDVLCTSTIFGIFTCIRISCPSKSKLHGCIVHLWALTVTNPWTSDTGSCETLDPDLKVDRTDPPLPVSNETRMWYSCQSGHVKHHYVVVAVCDGKGKVSNVLEQSPLCTEIGEYCVAKNFSSMENTGPSLILLYTAQPEFCYYKRTKSCDISPECWRPLYYHVLGTKRNFIY